MKYNTWGFTIKIDMFSQYLVCFIAKDKKSLFEDSKHILKDMGLSKIGKLSTHEGMKLVLGDKELTQGCTLELKNEAGWVLPIVVIRASSLKSLSQAVIVHELFHTMRAICNCVGADDEETSAYMLDYLYSQFNSNIEQCIKLSKPSKKKKS